MPTAACSIASIDATIPQRLFGRAVRPGSRREVHNAGILLFEGTSRSNHGGAPVVEHRFFVEFGSENGAAVVANWLWNCLHGHATALKVGDDEVPIQNGAIKRALIAAGSHGLQHAG
jgi:hypothetical protein